MEKRQCDLTGLLKLHDQLGGPLWRDFCCLLRLVVIEPQQPLLQLSSAQEDETLFGKAMAPRAGARIVAEEGVDLLFVALLDVKFQEGILDQGSDILEQRVVILPDALRVRGERRIDKLCHLHGVLLELTNLIAVDLLKGFAEPLSSSGLSLGRIDNSARLLVEIFDKAAERHFVILIMTEDRMVLEV